MTRSRNTQASLTPDQITFADSTVNWAFWAMNEATLSALGNDSRSNLTLTDVALAGTDGTEWTDRVGWLSGDATALKGSLTYATDADIADVCDFSGKSAIIGFQTIAAAGLVARDTLLHIGGKLTATRYGLWVAQDTNDKLIAQLKDNSGGATSICTSGAGSDQDGAAFWNVLITIDGDAQQLTINMSNASTPLVDIPTSAVSTSALADMTFSTQPSAALNIMVDTSSSPLYFAGDMRRLLMVNYGAKALPSNISDIKTSLYRSGMLPTWELANGTAGDAL